jgi:hypothetical protein
MSKAIRWTAAEIDSWVKRRLARHAAGGAGAPLLETKVVITGIAGGGQPNQYKRGSPHVPGTKLYPLIMLCEAHGLPQPMPEYPFAQELGRLYRADYCWPAPEHRIIVEINGGAFLAGGGRHTRGAGYREDLKRSNLAAVLGYRILQYLPENYSDAIADLKQIFKC